MPGPRAPDRPLLRHVPERPQRRLALGPAQRAAGPSRLARPHRLPGPPVSQLRHAGLPLPVPQHQRRGGPRGGQQRLRELLELVRLPPRTLSASGGSGQGRSAPAQLLLRRRLRRRARHPAERPQHARRVRGQLHPRRPRRGAPGVAGQGQPSGRGQLPLRRQARGLAAPALGGKAPPARQRGGLRAQPLHQRGRRPGRERLHRRHEGPRPDARRAPLRHDVGGGGVGGVPSRPGARAALTRRRAPSCRPGQCRR